MALYFGNKIKAARKAAGMTQRQLASKIGVKNTSISNWEKNISRPDPDTIAKICGALEIDAGFLFDAEPGICNDKAQNPLGFEPMPNMTKIPLIGDIACGEPITAEENVIDHISVVERWHANFALRCHGNSMEPKIHDGDIVAIRKQPTVENGQIAAVRIGDEATLKKVYAYQDRMILQPINTSYEPIMLLREEMNTTAIEGKAVGLCRDL